MANLSYAQLKGVWLQAAAGTKYATNAWASLMAAIAEAESGGNPGATNPTDNNGTQTSWGLWQISNGTHAAPAGNWADPVVNAKLAIGKLNGQGLSAWGTYDSGAYQAYLSDKTAADVAGITGPSAVDTAELTSATTAKSDCLWPPAGRLSLGPVGVNVPCLLSKSEARAVIGAFLLITGGWIFGLGAIVIAVTAGVDAAGAAYGAVPGRLKGTVPVPT
jgi:Lysozyme like domain